MRQGGHTTNPATDPVSSTGSAPPPVPMHTRPVGYRAPGSAVKSQMMLRQGITYSSRTLPPPPLRSGQTPSPLSERSRDDPRRNWPQACGYQTESVSTLELESRECALLSVC